MLHFLSSTQDAEKNSPLPARNAPADAATRDARRWPFRVSEDASTELRALAGARERERERVADPACAFVT